MREIDVAELARRAVELSVSAETSACELPIDVGDRGFAAAVRDVSAETSACEPAIDRELAMFDAAARGVSAETSAFALPSDADREATAGNLSIVPDRGLCRLDAVLRDVSAETPPFEPPIDVGDRGFDAAVRDVSAETSAFAPRADVTDREVGFSIVAVGRMFDAARAFVETRDVGVGRPRIRATSATSRVGSRRSTAPVGHAWTHAGAS